MRGTPILLFRGMYAFLSNFYPSVVRVEGLSYPTVEHAFQALKTVNQREREAVSSCLTPALAKSMGRRVTLRPGWNNMRELVMWDLLQRKFDPVVHPDLCHRLVETGSVLLVEGNTWYDTFWGVCNGRGDNRLGKLLMKRRDELIA